MAHMIKMNFWIDPSVVVFKTLEFVVDDIYGQAFAFGICAFVEFATEELYAHNWKDEPKDKTDK